MLNGTTYIVRPRIEPRNRSCSFVRISAGSTQWFVGPASAIPPLSRMQATLIGVTTGRAVVHQFPGAGLYWAPGEGITAEITSLVDGLESVLCLAFAGYIMVT